GVRHRSGREVDDTELARRLLDERDRIQAALRDRIGWVLLVDSVRATGDFLALYFALRATGAHVNPAAVLAAFIVSNIAGMIPLTPGGLGFVEASLTGVLPIAGAGAAQANLTVATYRLAATWLPCLAGAVAFVWFRHRHRPVHGVVVAGRARSPHPPARQPARPPLLAPPRPQG